MAEPSLADQQVEALIREDLYHGAVEQAKSRLADLQDPKKRAALQAVIKEYEGANR